MQSFQNARSGDIVLSMADRIIENRACLSEIDGKIGDGDHGVNMAKGFGMAAERLKGQDASLADALDRLGTVLMTEIGGSMGPLYGVMFTINRLESCRQGIVALPQTVNTLQRLDFPDVLRGGIGACLSRTRASGRWLRLFNTVRQESL